MDTIDSTFIFLQDYLTFLIAALILYIQGLFGWNIYIILLVCLEVLAVWAYLVFVVNEGKPFREHDDTQNDTQNILPAILNAQNIESAQWVNAAVAKMWPIVKANIEKNLKTEVKNVLKKYHLGCTVIKQFDIGKKPPQFNGILNRTTADNNNQIVLDLSTDFSGSDCVFKLKLKCFCIGIKNVSIRGMLRAELNQLTDKPPFVRTIACYFLTKPEFDYKYVKYSVLFKTFQVRKIIKNFIKNNFVFPNQFIYTIPEEIQAMNVQADSAIVHSDVIKRANLGYTKIAKDNSIIDKVVRQGMKVQANSSIVHSDGISQASLGIPKKITKDNSSSSNAVKRVNLRGYCCAFHLHYHETKRRAKFYRTAGLHKLSGHKPNY